MATWESAPRTSFRRCYWDCSEWLAQVFVPWRWVITFHEATRDFRAEMIRQTAA